MYASESVCVIYTHISLYTHAHQDEKDASTFILGVVCVYHTHRCVCGVRVLQMRVFVYGVWRVCISAYVCIIYTHT